MLRAVLKLDEMNKLIIASTVAFLASPTLLLAQSQPSPQQTYTPPQATTGTADPTSGRSFEGRNVYAPQPSTTVEPYIERSVEQDSRSRR